ncbi:hypothetical protein G6L37_00570 [Agrobacterium rubi]|nr:hypothetical protein [Agrobacterium rubi]NTF23883.1 hypothetical protein [Agrobacterium rubi]
MSKLFHIVNALEITDLQTTYDEYSDWCDETGEEVYPMRHFRYSLTERDQKWVILDAMQRQIADDPDATTVSSEHILCAINDSVFPPSLETHFETFCERVLVEFQKPEAPTPS